MFETFRKYLQDPKDDNKSMKHSLYPIRFENLEKADRLFSIPSELKLFYKEIGYGFFHNNKGAFNRLLSPLQVAEINSREGFYEFDPELDSYEERYKGGKILFFEVNEGIYLAMDKLDTKGENAIYLFDKKISDSLEKFLTEFDLNYNLINDIYKFL